MWLVTSACRAKADGEDFDSATWLHKAKNLQKEGFKSEVERHLTGKETEPWEILDFEFCKSQPRIPIHSFQSNKAD